MPGKKKITKTYYRFVALLLCGLYSVLWARIVPFYYMKTEFLWYVYIVAAELFFFPIHVTLRVGTQHLNRYNTVPSYIIVGIIKYRTARRGGRFIFVLFP